MVQRFTEGGLLPNGSASPSQLLCRRDVFRWCPRSETRRLYSRCGCRSPNAFEAAGLATLTIASRRNARVRFPGASSKSAGYSYRSSVLFTRCFTVLCVGHSAEYRPSAVPHMLSAHSGLGSLTLHVCRTQWRSLSSRSHAEVIVATTHIRLNGAAHNHNNLLPLDGKKWRRVDCSVGESAERLQVGGCKVASRLL